ncbi:MAG: hypothetical protein KAQ65_09335 [Candidatus Thorarchaeota archaeon]|nr:hypothetical protein [Candidatus Thorarchaeota archaeon]MCK5240695.1 hypothetical protein [Candidatus Thorarchaeota archaeon]
MKTEKKLFKENFVDAKMKRNWITSKLPKLTYEQVDLLYSMVTRWLKEEEASR